MTGRPAAPDAELGPQPTPAGPAVVTAAQAEILERLRDHFLPVTARALAQEHGLHPNTVREHLDVLVERGLASRTRLPSQGRGRPSYGYSATTALSELQAHAALVDALSDHLAATAEDPAATAEELGRRYAEQIRLPEPAEPPPVLSADRPAPAVMPALELVRELTAPEPVLPDADDAAASDEDDPGEGAAFAALTAYMSRLGFGPEPVEQKAGVARLLTCPLLGAARRHQEVVCGFHRGMLRGLLDRQLVTGIDVSLDAFAEPGACLLTLSQVPAGTPDPAGGNR